MVSKTFYINPAEVNLFFQKNSFTLEYLQIQSDSSIFNFEIHNLSDVKWTSANVTLIIQFRSLKKHHTHRLKLRLGKPSPELSEFWGISKRRKKNKNPCNKFKRSFFLKLYINHAHLTTVLLYLLLREK